MAYGYDWENLTGTHYEIASSTAAITPSAWSTCSARSRSTWPGLDGEGVPRPA